MANTDLTWTDERVAAAEADGWQLAFTFDNGKVPGYLRIYPKGPKFASPFAAARAVLAAAQLGNKLCTAALHAIAASRLPPAPKAKK